MADVDLKSLLEGVQRAVGNGSAREWTASGVRVGRVDFRTVKTSGRKDTLDFIETMKVAAELSLLSPMSTQSSVTPALVPELNKQTGEMLSLAIVAYLADLEAAKRDPKTILESRHSLRILLDEVGDIPANALSQNHVRAFFDALRHWPSNATKRPKYRNLSVPGVLALLKARNEPEPAAHPLNKPGQKIKNRQSRRFVPLAQPVSGALFLTLQGN